MRRLVLVGSVTLGLLVPAGADAAPHRTRACEGKRGAVIARGEAGRVVEVGSQDDGFYGPIPSLRFCRGKLQVRREDGAENGEGIAVGRRASTRRYLALSLTSTSSQCEKYSPGADECVTERLESVDMRTGRLRTSAAGSADRLVVSSAGWIAWAQDGGIFASVSGATRTLDAGPGVPPASLGLAGSTVSWSRSDGSPAAATLR